MTPDLPLLDLDGLIRHWKGTGTREGERLAGLPDGALEAACTLPGYILAQLGVLADEQWADAIRDHLISHYGPSARKAIPTWRARPAHARSAASKIVVYETRSPVVRSIRSATWALLQEPRPAGRALSVSQFTLSASERRVGSAPSVVSSGIATPIPAICAAGQAREFRRGG